MSAPDNESVIRAKPTAPPAAEARSGAGSDTAMHAMLKKRQMNATNDEDAPAPDGARVDSGGK